jgi:hypothetical protein
MTTYVEINGSNFLPIKDAAKSFSYTRDYVARLAREQKIVATQIGRQWFVDPVSLQSFVETSQLEQEVKKKQLSLERKKEQLIKHEVGLIKKDRSKKVRSLKLHAQLVSAFVLAVGLMAGAGIYTTSTLFESQSSNVATVKKSLSPQESVSTVTVPESEFSLAEPQATTMFNNVLEYPVFIDESETRAMSIGNTEGIFLLARDGEVRSAEETASLFSDEVEVKFEGDSTGVVTYTDSEGVEKEYSFVSVPVGKTAEKIVKAETI